MKNVRLILMAFLGAVSLNSCGENQKKESTEDPGMPMQNEMHMEGEQKHSMRHGEENLDNGASGEVKFTDQDLATIYSHYQHIKSALVNTDQKEASKGAAMLVQSLENSEYPAALKASKEIADAKGINEQRTSFSNLSAAMEELVSGALVSGEIYKQFCPMAFEGKGGYWLSSSQEIRNPYFGNKMLKCGSVRDTIK